MTVPFLRFKVYTGKMELKAWRTYSLDTYGVELGYSKVCGF